MDNEEKAKCTASTWMTNAERVIYQYVKK